MAQRHRENAIRRGKGENLDDTNLDDAEGAGLNTPGRRMDIGMQYLSHVNSAAAANSYRRPGGSRHRAQALANDDEMPPATKLDLVREEIDRLTTFKQPGEGRHQEAAADNASSSARAKSPGKKSKKSKRLHEAVNDGATAGTADPNAPQSVAADVDWELLNEYLIIQYALCRLLYGDWAIEVASADYELSVSYLMLQQPVMARDHADSARKTAHAVLERDPLLEIKCDVVEAAALVMSRCELPKAVTCATRACDNYLRHVLVEKDDPTMFPLYYLKTAALFAEGSSHQRALDALDAALDCCEMRHLPSWSDVFHLHVVKLTAHFELLSRSVHELLNIPAQSSKEKILEQLAEVSTQGQLTVIHEQLNSDLQALSEKRKALQLTCVRQITHIREETARSLQQWTPKPRPGAAEGQTEPQQFHEVSDICAAQLVQVARMLHAAGRAEWVGQHAKEAAELCNLAGTMFDICLGTLHPVTLQSQLDAALLSTGSAGAPTVSFLSSWQLHCEPTPTTNSIATLDISRENFRAEVANIRRRVNAEERKQKKKEKKSPRTSHKRTTSGSSQGSGQHYSSSSPSPAPSDSESDSESDVDTGKEVEHREKGCKRLEEVLALLSTQYGPHSNIAHSISLALEKAYSRLGDHTREATHTAMLCDIYAQALGPTHHKTVSKLTEYEGKRQKVHAPLFSPSWGVMKLLSQVTLSTATPGADIYFTTNGETPSEDPGVHQSMVYTGPIVLDTLGRVKIKAFAVLNGKRSGIVEGQYSVMRQ